MSEQTAERTQTSRANRPLNRPPVTMPRRNEKVVPNQAICAAIPNNYTVLIKGEQPGVVIPRTYSQPKVNYVMVTLDKRMFDDDNKIALKQMIYNIAIPFATDDPQYVKALRDGFTSREVTLALAQSGAFGQLYHLIEIPDDDALQVTDEDTFSAEAFMENSGPDVTRQQEASKTQERMNLEKKIKMPTKKRSSRDVPVVGSTHVRAQSGPSEASQNPPVLRG